jgi:hypothetical protein
MIPKKKAAEKMQCHEIFQVLISIVSLSLSLALMYCIYLDLNLRSFSSPAFSSFWGSKKNPKTHEIADPKPQLRHQGHRNPNDKSSPWIR